MVPAGRPWRRSRAGEATAWMEEVLAGASVPDAQKAVRSGRPAGELTAAAADLDLLVVGSCRRAPLERVLAGSVSEALVEPRTCPCSWCRVEPRRPRCRCDRPPLPHPARDRRWRRLSRRRGGHGRQAKQDGSRWLRDTPHPPGPRRSDRGVGRRVAELNRELDRRGIAVRIAQGGELSETAADRSRRRRAPRDLAQLQRKLGAARTSARPDRRFSRRDRAPAARLAYRPVIAHPERRRPREGASVESTMSRSDAGPPPRR